ncbi:MAG: toxin-antitoxin system HicB family antitoxin [Demequinaceae bacterium]|nr:toxin-antitoxin system HicB family antitoxin [Demequinaceae bacterium]
MPEAQEFPLTVPRVYGHRTDGGVRAQAPLAGRAVSRCREHVGKFVVRLTPSRHRALAIKAAQSGVSMNRLVSDTLAAR